MRQAVVDDPGARVNAIDWSAVRAEAAALLSHLLQLDTTNPPGNETRVAEFLADYLTDRGLPVRLLGARPDRLNLLARLPGTGARPPILLLGHTDVVYADAADWRLPPFGGVIHDGFIWGRGALDMKGLLAMQVMALCLARRFDLRLARDVLLLASADEEDTGCYGAGWVVDNHWDAVASEFVYSEGGVGVELHGRTVFLVATAEKGYADLTLTARGHVSHASLASADNALIHLAQALQRIAGHRSNVRIVEPLAQHIRALMPILPWSTRLLLLALRAPGLAAWAADRLTEPTLRQSLRNTITPTMASAGRQPNVVPDHAEATVNCRTLPGVSVDDLIAEVQRVIGHDSIGIRIRQWSQASASPVATEFFAALTAVLRTEAHNAIVAPYLMPGATDGRFFRARGVTTYGLIPIILSVEEMAAIHGVDERLSLDHLEFGTRALFRLVCALGHAG